MSIVHGGKTIYNSNQEHVKSEHEHFGYNSLSIKIDEKGTLKATKHDNYENIAGSV
jgi:hypothetical protein